MSDEFLRRLEAVERAVSNGQTDLTAVSDAAATTERLARVEARVDDLEADLAALGTASRIEFSVRTVILVAVPPGKTGVGDTDGQASETSPGWGSEWTF